MNKLLGRALLWRDAAAGGYFDWAEKQGLTSVSAQAAGLKYTDWTEAPLGSAGEAWRWFKNKIPMTREEFLGLAKASHARAFTIAGAENDRLIKTIKALAGDAIKGDLTRAEFVKSARLAWDTLGVTRANPFHLETTILTNLHSAANAARWSELQRDSEGLRAFYPYLQFLTVGDEAVCEICGPRDGKIYGRDDPFWQTNYPPLHHRCRCEVLEVSVLDAETEGLKPSQGYPVAPPPSEGFDRPPAELAGPVPEIILQENSHAHADADERRKAKRLYVPLHGRSWNGRRIWGRGSASCGL